jgi:hypothetical protein
MDCGQVVKRLGRQYCNAITSRTGAVKYGVGNTMLKERYLAQSGFFCDASGV